MSPKLFVAITLLCCCGANASCPDGGQLRVNHGQLLATHNSYHVATTTTWPYSFPSLHKQLENGVRGFEIDMWWDLDTTSTTGSFRVMHLPNSDEGTTCSTLAECLGDAKKFSDSNPCHFPLFFQLEVLGTVKKSNPAGTPDSNTCKWSDVEDLAACTADKCWDVTPGEVQSCVSSKCLSFVLPLSGGPCSGSLSCLKTEVEKSDANQEIGRTPITKAFETCVDTSTLPTLQSDSFKMSSGPTASEVYNALETIIDEAWGEEAQRVIPAEVTMSNGVHEWPLVDDARGQAIFWVNVNNAESAWKSAPMNSAPSGFFLSDGAANSAIVKVDDVTGGTTARDATKTGTLVRSRADTAEVIDQSRRENTVQSGSFAVTTDYPPVTVAGKYAWPPADSSSFKVPGGKPVACNTVALQGVDGVPLLACDPLALEALPTTSSPTLPTASPSLSTSSPTSTAATSQHAVSAFAVASFACAALAFK